MEIDDKLKVGLRKIYWNDIFRHVWNTCSFEVIIIRKVLVRSNKFYTKIIGILCLSYKLINNAFT